MTFKDNKILNTILKPEVVTVVYLIFKAVQFAVAVAYEDQVIIRLVSLVVHLPLAYYVFKGVRPALIFMGLLVGVPGAYAVFIGAATLPQGFAYIKVFFILYGLYCATGGFVMFRKGQSRQLETNQNVS